MNNETYLELSIIGDYIVTPMYQELQTAPQA